MTFGAHLVHAERPVSPAPTPGSGRLLKVEEVADRLRACRATVHKPIETGKLPAVRIGGVWLRVREEDVDGLLTEHEHGEGGGRSGPAHPGAFVGCATGQNRAL